MFKSIALSSILLRNAAAETGCYPQWTSGSPYTFGSLVSAVLDVNVTAGTTVTKNFMCVNGNIPSLSHCPSYDPSIAAQREGAWSDQGECTGTAVTGSPTSEPTGSPTSTPTSAPTGSPTSKPTHGAWSGAGCPEDWVEGHSYEGGDIAALDGIVYKCSEVQFENAWCGESSYKPGDSQYWERVWTLLGSCTGTIAPSSSPVYVSLTDAGGCPDAFSADATYEEGDKVEMNGVVYECNSWPNSAFCSRKDYEPDSANSAEAWTLLGYCEGTIAPSSSPVFVDLINAGGCPGAYSDSGEYEAGDKVSVEASAGVLVYECEDSPNDAFCNQFEPGHWSKQGWTLKGYCEGTIAPTSSPVFVSLTDHNGCPEAYSDSAFYEADDKVSVDIDGTYSLVYQCVSDVHDSRFCSKDEPGSDSPGWTLIGHCTGTIAPTSAPIFATLTDVGGCPPAYDSATAYKEGDVASVVVSDDPERTVVYECKAWPDGAYCNAGPNFAPNSDNAALGWTLQGSCDGTIAPTASPIAYAPAAKCRWYNGTQPVIINTWAESSLSSYGAGTRVRKGDRIYKCKGYPASLWCRMAAYEPEETTYWADAWVEAGTCVDAFAPTTSPSISPTASPSTTPTTSPTSSPSTSPTASPSSSPSTSPTASPSTSPTTSPTKSPTVP